MTPHWLYLTEATSGEMTGLHDSGTLSVVHYAASVASKTLPQAAQGLLAAMGKDFTVTGMRGHASEAVHVLPTWLAGYDTKVVILSRAQSWQRPEILTELLRLLAATPVIVVVATDPGTPGHVPASLRGFRPSSIAAADVPALLPPRHTPADPDRCENLSPRVEVPPSTWATFRYDCRASLTPAQFTHVDTAYVEAFTTARSNLSQSSPTNESTQDTLTRILHTSRDAATATAAFRGTQAAYFDAGYNLRLDPQRLISLYAHSRPPEFTEGDWLALRAYVDPARPAACALYAHGLTLIDIAAFTLADAEAIINTGTLTGQSLNRHATTYLTTNFLHQRAQPTASATSAFIPLHPVSRVLTAAGKDVGILIAGKPTQSSAHTKAIWTAGTGFLLKAIA